MVDGLECGKGGEGEGEGLQYKWVGSVIDFLLLRVGLIDIASIMLDDGCGCL
jgi:molybdate-binding protein